MQCGEFDKHILVLPEPCVIKTENTCAALSYSLCPLQLTYLPSSGPGTHSISLF